MGHMIEIDSDVWTRLQDEAEPFTDTPNSVLRRVLGMDPTGSDLEEGRSERERPESLRETRNGRRAPAGSLLPESAYETPILEAIAQQGGRAAAREVIAAVGKAVEAKLTPLDREVLPNGGKRWENRVQFARLRLKERGMLLSGSPRGVWEISDEGRTELAKKVSDAQA